MALTRKFAPPNSVVLISDIDVGEVPRTMGGRLVSATSTCVAVGCLSEHDGETEFSLAPLSEVNRADAPAYDGMLRTPKHYVVIRSVLGQRLLELPVLQDLTRIKVWTSDTSEPDHILVGVS